ncbi:MAG TPA: hypothetical protein VGJ77_09055 [Gaiellaceae bacterium]|jgi:hypothetical protein
MRRKLWIAIFAAAVGASFAIVPLTASGGSGGHVMIAERNLFTSSSTQDGTFSIAGAISDSGPVHATFTVTPSGDGSAVLEGDHVLQGSLGTLTVHTRARVYPFPASRSFVEGKWNVVSGTGTYADMQGGGSVKAVGDFVNGTATIIRDGAVNG